ncbi:nitroreductase family protein [Polynucleobacter sp. 71A-WALBACH]|uniref:nitroreductase family protein n=1 Tax=Polynucleobacter sp. 71A-WALBACH TaxID=2689097 RepID=UPI001C0E38B3|nr:nitroreductase family protein [Polynucleobacter sp. 71A-WALBACH]MBU3593988.1 nitroreductase family protein [Polynucleobacter sp. 71A-WALBACH]
MNTFDAIRERRAVKHFDPQHQFTKQETDELLDLAIQSPSSFNIQHWRLVNVTDKALSVKLREAAFDQAQVTDGSLLFVVTVDIKAWEKDPARYWTNAPKEAQDILVPWINPFYSGKEQLQRDEAMRSAGIMLQTMMLSAKAMGYDSCPMVGFDFDKVAELIHLPKDYAIAAMLVIGKGIKPAWPKPGFIPKSEMIVENHF